MIECSLLAEDQSSVLSTTRKLFAVVAFSGSHIALFRTPEMRVVGFCVMCFTELHYQTHIHIKQTSHRNQKQKTRKKKNPSVSRVLLPPTDSETFVGTHRSLCNYHVYVTRLEASRKLGN